MGGWPKILEIPFHSGLVSPSPEIEFNMADPHQASKHNISALSDKRLKYLTST